MTAVEQPGPVLSSAPGSFPWRVLAERHPVLIEQVRSAFPYGARQQAALDALKLSCAEGVIEGPDDHGWGPEWLGRSWFDVPFIVAENFFYQRLLEAVEFFGPGSWQGVDPFAPMKGAELLRLDVARPPDGRTALLGAVWGNQADLGFRITAELDAANAGPQQEFRPAEGGLIDDHSEAIWARLSSPPSTVIIVTDNAGQELAADLLLAAHLLGEGLAARIELHLKPSPYFVSDAMPSDVAAVLQAIARTSEDGARIATDLRSAATEDRLTLHTHGFYCSPRFYADLPHDLAARYAAAGLVILKGDLNYRRLVGDLHWPPTTPFADTVAGIDAPVATLRTLKSDVIVGLEPETVGTLDTADENWRTSGRYAVIQARL